MGNQLTQKQVEDAFQAAVDKDNLCPLGRVIEDAAPEVGRVIAAKAADQSRYSGTTISRVLKGLGFPPVSSEVVNKHRKGACRCPVKETA